MSPRKITTATERLEELDTTLAQREQEQRAIETARQDANRQLDAAREALIQARVVGKSETTAKAAIERAERLLAEDDGIARETARRRVAAAKADIERHLREAHDDLMADLAPQAAAVQAQVEAWLEAGSIVVADWSAVNAKATRLLVARYGTNVRPDPMRQSLSQLARLAGRELAEGVPNPTGKPPAPAVVVDYDSPDENVRFRARDKIKQAAR